MLRLKMLRKEGKRGEQKWGQTNGQTAGGKWREIEKTRDTGRESDKNRE